MIQIKCAGCQSLLAFEDSMAGSLVVCPDCYQRLHIPGPLDAGEMPGTVVVRLNGPGRWVLFDFISLPIVVDGREVGKGSVKRGFDVVVKMAVGTHKVEIGAAAHTLAFPHPGEYEVEFEFSRTWGSYCLKPTIERVRATESNDWPTAQGVRVGVSKERPSGKQVEPIDLERADGAISPEDEVVLAELAHLQEQRPGWAGAITLLVISLVMYIGAGGVEQILQSLLILIPVLLFHELGHYLVMRGFGYRNLRMFFIPFLGAAVTGQHYNIAGWKKALVALAGPLPGILLGVPLGVIGLSLNEPKVMEVAMLMLILNGFNLLPFLPLDGGWIVHAVLFVRSPVLDVVFRVAAALAMIGLAIVLPSWFLGVIAFFMLIAAPLAFRLSRIAHRLRQEGLVARSIDAHTIPAEAALQILAALRRALPPQTSPKVFAQHVANVFEMFNAEPPGMLVSLGLLALHAGAFVVALVMAILFTVLQQRPH